MFEFNVAAFADRLAKLPERPVLAEAGTHSRYLQENVFDELKQGHAVDLLALDFDAFTFQDLTPEGHVNSLARSNGTWAECFNRFVKQTPATPRSDQSFF